MGPFSPFFSLWIDISLVGDLIELLGNGLLLLLIVDVVESLDDLRGINDGGIFGGMPPVKSEDLMLLISYNFGFGGSGGGLTGNFAPLGSLAARCCHFWASSLNFFTDSGLDRKLLLLPLVDDESEEYVDELEDECTKLWTL